MRLIFLSGFAMFTMFFGSGNLVFPLNLGTQSTETVISALLGLFITAVFVPFLGLVGLILYEGDRKKFFAPLGKTISYLIIIVSLCLMAFGVSPRCMWVGYGGLHVMGAQYPFYLYALFFLLLLSLMVWRKNRVMDIVAYVLTPFKFGSIALLLIAGIWQGNTPPLGQWSYPAFWNGLTQGYQTLDLIAAFFFACTIYDYIKQKEPHAEKQYLIAYALKASCLGGGLLAIIYAGFVYLGASYASILQTVEPQNMLPAVAKSALGQGGLYLVAFTVFVACLATATVLTNLFIDFLKENLLKNKINHSMAVVMTLSGEFCFSLFGFKEICTVMGSFLFWAYPLLILYTVIQIARYRKSA